MAFKRRSNSRGARRFGTIRKAAVGRRRGRSVGAGRGRHSTRGRSGSRDRVVRLVIESAGQQPQVAQPAIGVMAVPRTKRAF